MKIRNIKRLSVLLFAVLLCMILLPVTALAANFPSKFYASVNVRYSSYSKSEIFGTVTLSDGSLTYNALGEKVDRDVYGMEAAGNVIYTVEGVKLPKSVDNGFRELRVYNSDLTSCQVIGEVNEENGTYWIVDTAIDLSGAEPALYGTYQEYVFVPEIFNFVLYSYICQIDLTNGEILNTQAVSGLPSTDIIYTIAFDKDGILYAIGADSGENGGPASLYTIDLDTGEATLVNPITSSSGSAIYTNFIQDMAFDYATGALYWMENDSVILYTLDTETAMATVVGRRSSAFSAFCIPYDGAFPGDQHMISVICEGVGTVTNMDDDSSSSYYMVEDNDSITLKITPGEGSGLRYVKVDGKDVPLDGLEENGYSFEEVTENHVIEVGFKLAIPATQHNITWFDYQGYPAEFYTNHHVYKFYELPYLDKEAPRDDYIQTLLDEEGNPIDNTTIILPGYYDVHVTHPGNEKYAALDEIYKNALQLGKCNGTPGRPVVYGKVGCTQGDLATTTYLQDYYDGNGELFDSAHDNIPVTLVWLAPETIYNEEGYFLAPATIHAAMDLDQHILACYNLEDGTPIYGGCEISSRSTQVVVLSAEEASLIKLQMNDASGGTVSGQGVFKNNDPVTVTASVNKDAGYSFGGWEEDGKIVYTEESYTFSAAGDRVLTARFDINEDYRLILQIDPQDGGTVNGGGSYGDGDHKANITATPNQGFYFLGWFEGGTLVDSRASFTFDVPPKGTTLTAKFAADYLSRAEKAQATFASTIGEDSFEWATLVQAVDTYEAAKTFVTTGAGSTWDDAETRFAALTDYYNGITSLDLSMLGIDSADLEKLYLFSNVTDLDLSGNLGITNLAGLKDELALETLDISGTGVTTANVLVSGDALIIPSLKTLTAQNLSLFSISALAELVKAADFNADTVTLWDFSNSTLTESEENKADVEAIETKLGKKFQPPTIQISPVYDIAASLNRLDFGSVYTNYEQPDAQTLTITNKGNQNVTLTLSASDYYLFGAFSPSADVAPGGTATFTVQPKQGLPAGNYGEVLTVVGQSGDQTINANVTLLFEVKRQPGSGGTSSDPNTYPVTISETFTGGSITVSPRSAAKDDTVTITVRPDEGYALDQLTVTDRKGNELSLKDKGNGKYTFIMPGFLVSVEAIFKPAALANRFIDVQKGDYCYDAVLWAVENGVTNGLSATMFGPDAPVSRAQMVTFLWRAYGAPKATGSNPFTDVDKNDYYYDAVLWAVTNGVTNGTSATTFNPDAPVTRSQAVTFQWRAAGHPAATGQSFADVAADAYYINAVSWAVANGITVGTGGNNFSPDAVVSRGQAVTFLYRELV